MTRRLIVNADDFGVAKATNIAIAELFIAGRITSSSLLARAEETEDAVSLTKKHNIPFGVHLTLNSDFKEYPWRAACGCQTSLSDANGFLYDDTAYIKKHARFQDVTRECEAQIKRITDMGIAPDHLDNHCGTMYGINLRPFFINAFKLCRKYHLPFRFPKRGRFLQNYFKGSIPFYVKAAHKAVAFCGTIMGAKLIDDMVTNPYPIKDIPDYKALERYYLDEITKIGEGVTELFLHPSYPVEKFSLITPEWKKRGFELDFLMSDAYQNRIKDEGIELISYKDISY